MAVCHMFNHCFILSFQLCFLFLKVAIQLFLCYWLNCAHAFFHIHDKRRKRKRFCYINGFLIYYRSKSSAGVSGFNKLEGSFEPTSSDTSTVVKNEMESVLPRNRIALLEHKVVTKGTNKYVFSSLITNSFVEMYQ